MRCHPSDRLKVMEEGEFDLRLGFPDRFGWGFQQIRLVLALVFVSY